jgi:hypothetical protein
MLAEYEALRAEARQRISNQLVIFGGAIALATALIPIAQHTRSGTRWEVYLAASVLFGLVGGLYFDQHHMVNQVARYIECELRPRLLRELNMARNDPGLWGWENWLRQKDRRKLTFSFRILATLGVGLTSLIGALALALQGHVAFHWYDGIALAADVAIYGGLVALLVYWYRHNRLFPTVATFPLTVHDGDSAVTPPVASAAGQS